MTSVCGLDLRDFFSFAYFCAIFFKGEQEGVQGSAQGDQEAGEQGEEHQQVDRQFAHVKFAQKKIIYRLGTIKQCCGSLSVILSIFDPRIRDPE
jgi:hypothetical protein